MGDTVVGNPAAQVITSSRGRLRFSDGRVWEVRPRAPPGLPRNRSSRAKNGVPRDTLPVLFHRLAFRSQGQPKIEGRTKTAASTSSASKNAGRHRGTVLSPRCKRTFVVRMKAPWTRPRTHASGEESQLSVLQECGSSLLKAPGQFLCFCRNFVGNDVVSRGLQNVFPSSTFRYQSALCLTAFAKFQTGFQSRTCLAFHCLNAAARPHEKKARKAGASVIIFRGKGRVISVTNSCTGLLESRAGPKLKAPQRSWLEAGIFRQACTKPR